MVDTAPHKDIPILRDSTFFRATADNAVVMHLGRDTEVAFLVNSPTPRANRETITAEGIEDDEISAVQMQATVYEVARVRMAPESWLTVAIQMVYQSIRNGDTTQAEFVKTLQSFTEANLTDDGLVER